MSKWVDSKYTRRDIYKDNHVFNGVVVVKFGQYFDIFVIPSASLKVNSLYKCMASLFKSISVRMSLCLYGHRPFNAI